MNNASFALLAGVFFGLGPIFVNKSGFPGYVAILILAITAFIIELPFAIGQFSIIANPRWSMIIHAGVFFAVGSILFYGMLARAPVRELGALFMICLLAQLAVPAVHHVLKNGGLSLEKGVGLACAIIAGVLLSR